MNFVQIQQWFFKERINPLREDISSILEACDKISSVIPESEIKADNFKGDAQKIIYSIDNNIPSSPLYILVGRKKFNVAINDDFLGLFKFFTKVYNVNVELVALSFNDTYKIVFTADLFETYIPTLKSELATAFPNATITVSKQNKTLSITNKL